MSQSSDTYRFKCHHSLKIRDGAITKSMVHAFIDPEIKVKQPQRLTNE